jgi:hypothetical protein
MTSARQHTLNRNTTYLLLQARERHCRIILGMLLFRKQIPVEYHKQNPTRNVINKYRLKLILV